MRRVRVAAIVLAMALVAGACSGPKPALTFGGKAVPVNVAFGKPGEDDPRAKQEYELAPVTGGFGVVPVAPKRKTTFTTEPPPPPAVPPKAICRKADPTVLADLPSAEAGRDFAGPPKVGEIPFRIEGQYTEAGERLAYRGTLGRAVTKSTVDEQGAIRFTVQTTGAQVATETTYVSTQANDRVPGAFALESVVVAENFGDLEGRPEFKAVKPVTQMQMQPTPGLTWNDASSDPLTGSAMTVSGKVIGKSRVDACGKLVDAWQVVLEQKFVTPLQRVESEATYWVATQYGGLIVQEAVSYTGTAGGTPFSGDYTATVIKDPGA